jgi:hypothetical protein
LVLKAVALVHVQQILNEDKSKQNDFGPIVLCMVWRLAKGKSKPNIHCWSTRWLDGCEFAKFYFKKKKGKTKGMKIKRNKIIS